MDLNRLERARRPVRNELKKTIEELKAALKKKEPPVKDIRALQNVLDLTKEELDQLNCKVLDCLHDDTDKTEDEITDEREVIRQLNKEYYLIHEDVSKFTASQDDTASVAGSTAHQKKLKLPKVELSKFNGDLFKWLGWWARFQKIHNDEDLDDSDKFYYLSQCMETGSEAEKVIQSYPQSGENYQRAIGALKDRYGRKDLLLQVYLRELLKLTIRNAAKEDKIPLSQLYLELQSYLSSLAELELNKQDPATWLFPLIESCLTKDTLMAFQRSDYAKKDGSAENPPRTRLDYLMEFIQTEVRSEQQISLAQAGFHSTDETNSKKNKKQKVRVYEDDEVGTAAGLLSTTKISDKDSCAFCEKNHSSDRCITAQSMSLEERKKVIKDKGLCYVCIKGNHTARKCKVPVKCIVCGKKHYPILCPGSSSSSSVRKQERGGSSNEDSAGGAPTTVQNAASFQCTSDILLNTLMVDIQGCNGVKTRVRLVGDTGSQRSWIKKTTATKSNCEVISEECIQSILFGGECTSPKRHDKFAVKLKNPKGGAPVTLELLESKKICGNIPKVAKGKLTDELTQHGICHSDVGSGASEVDILIGSDYWGSLLTGNLKKLKCGLVAVETVLGWTVSGKISNNTAMTYLSLFSASIQEDISQIWNLEAIGVKDPITKKSAQDMEREALVQFKETVTRDEDGRYVVALPWKYDSVSLPTNFSLSEKMLHGASRKLINQDKWSQYDAVFKAWEEEGFISTTEENVWEGHFLPHRPVFKEASTTPVRPVYNASAKTQKHPSLNECLYKGPNLIELIPTILLRFREKEIGISADIRKAFQMIRVRDEDKKFQKFIWWTDSSMNQMKSYVHNRVVFGMTCSPFLLEAVIQHHLDLTAEDPEFLEQLRNSFYVDNLISSLSSREECEVFRNKANNVMNDARMELRQWAFSIGDDSGIGLLSNKRCGLESGDSIMFHEVNMPILGINWNRKKDELSYCIKHIVVPEHLTKRFLLSVTAQVFDPIGVLCPALVLPKLMIQEVWAHKMSWDEPVTEDCSTKFLKWIQEMHSLEDVAIPRMYQLSNITRREVHVFSDASHCAYAAVIFLKSVSATETKIQLLAAKSRVAPLKKGTIPRLELLGCLLAVRLAEMAKGSVAFLKETPFYFWSDSTCALIWIKKNADWGVFVRNRVDEIKMTTQTHQWNHVPGSANPADLPSRGCTPAQLVLSKWWEGPEWLHLEQEKWPTSSFDMEDKEAFLELKKSTAMTSVIVPSEPRFSTYRKNVAVTAWIKRYIDFKVTCTPIRGPTITLPELREAEKLIIRNLQQESFPNGGKEVGGLVTFTDKEGLIRVKTRLLNREDKESFKYPLLLPKRHPLISQIIMDLHRLHNHGGFNFLVGKVREKYWVIQSKRAVKRVLKECIQCKRHAVKPLEVAPVDLPSKRVNDAHPFETTGIDLAGPVRLSDYKSAWIIIFTCAVYRCVYLDVVTSLSTEAFLRALERFLNIYGRPNTIYTDNGTNFVGAANLFKTLNWKEIEIESGVKQIQWTFNPPTAAWWGAWWERLIRTVKDLLKRMIGRAKLSHDELRTCLSGIAATMNDRPLTGVAGERDDIVPLTPNMFLRGEIQTQFPDVIDALNMGKRYRKMKNLQVQLQARFRREYLSQLIMRKGKTEHRELKEGDIVLVGSDNRKRYEWPLGRITEILKGKDGHGRLVKVKTAFGNYLRPFQRIYPLEIPSSEEYVSKLSTPNEGAPMLEEIPIPDPRKVKAKHKENRMLTKSGRESKKPLRYGQWMYLIK